MHWELAGSVGLKASRGIGLVGDVGGIRGHQECRVSGVHWGAGRECRG